MNARELARLDKIIAEQRVVIQQLQAVRGSAMLRIIELERSNKLLRERAR